jgi:hypothetical protein
MMPQTNCYISISDLQILIEWFLSQGCRIISDKEYAEPKYVEYTTMQDDLSGVLTKPGLKLLFVVSSEWQQSPLVMGKAIRDGKPFYYISQKNGGPTIDVFFGQPVSNRDIGSSFIAYHSTFWNPPSNSMERPSEKLVACYRGATKLLRQRGRFIKVGSRRFILTEEAERSGLPLPPA